jgi:putative hydrolase of the HAD superfamily
MVGGDIALAHHRGQLGARIALVNHVFFDFFGTLVDYDPSTHPTYNAPLAFARRAGSTISVTASDAQWQHAWDHLEATAVSTGREYSMHQVAHRYWRLIGAPTLAAGAIDNLIAEYLDTWTESVSPAPHALECVTDLASDHRLTIVSNTHDPALVQRLVRRFGLHTAIDLVVTSVSVGWRKPHPLIFETALRERGAAARDAVFIGDNWDADVDGPRRVGMSAIYVGPATALRPSVTLQEAVHIVRSLP